MLRNVTDNPFAGMDGAEELLVKHQAVELIETEMKARGMTQAELAEACGLLQPHISEILRRKLDRFSVDRLNRVLAVFGRRVAVHYAIEPVSDAA
jgi:predicted XRE-type DNA-binding protein